MPERETAEAREARIAAARARGGTPRRIYETVDDAELAAVRADAARRLADSAATLSAEERLLARARTLEETALAALALARREESRELVDAARHELASALYLQGRLREAAAADGRWRGWCQRVGRAILRPDSESCACPEPTVPILSAEGAVIARKRMPKETRREQIYSPERASLVWILECLYCDECRAVVELPAALENLATAEVRFPRPNTGSDLDIFPDAP